MGRQQPERRLAWIDDGHCLSEAIKKSGMTQIAFGREMGVDAGTVTRWIYGRQAFKDIDLRKKASKILRCSLADLDPEKTELYPLMGSTPLSA